ncbi:MAG TPA: alpha/beta hydrolase [Pseudonocardia sp.]
MSPTSAPARPPEVSNARQAVSALSAPGPHDVLRGDLGMVGVPGVVYAPAAGLGLPALAFAHDWLQPVARYAELLRHLASWGIVVAAPDSHRGALPSHARFAADLRTALDVCVGVRLGEGRISVDARRTALAGHGIGGGVALLAAADAPRLAAVVTLAVAQTRPSAVEAARRVTVPTLHVVAGRDTVTPAAGHAEPIAAAAAGPVRLRTLRKADHTGFLDGKHWSDVLLTGGPDARTRRVTRALVTAFLLHHLADEDRADVLLDGKVKGTELTAPGAGT